MAVSLKAIASSTKKCHIVVTVGDTDERIDFSYKPNAYTPRLEKEAQTERESDLAGDILISMLVPVLATLDIESETGKPIPLTKEGLSDVPLRVLNELMSKINEDMDPGKKKSDDSGGSFSA